MLVSTYVETLRIHCLETGLFQVKEYWLIPPNHTQDYAVLYVVGGTVYLEVEGDLFELEAGDAYILTPGQYCVGSRPSPENTVFYWVTFSLPDPSKEPLRTGKITLLDGHRVTICFCQLLHYRQTAGYPPCTMDLMLSLLLVELSTAQKTQATSHERLIRNVRDWIRANSDRKLSVVETARHFSYHPDYLCTLFRQALGVSLKQFINTERIKKAKEQLLATSIPIKALAGKLGWDNENQFVHFFKYHEHISPSCYRAMYRHDGDGPHDAAD